MKLCINYKEAENLAEMRLSVKLLVKASLSLRQSQERQGHCCCIENYPWENGQGEIFAVVLGSFQHNEALISIL